MKNSKKIFAILSFIMSAGIAQAQNAGPQPVLGEMRDDSSNIIAICNCLEKQAGGMDSNCRNILASASGEATSQKH